LAQAGAPITCLGFFVSTSFQKELVMALGTLRGHRELKAYSPKGRRKKKRARNKIARMLARASSHELQHEMAIVTAVRRDLGPAAKPAQPLQAQQRPTKSLAEYIRERRRQRYAS
jgi:hypothetical protein